MESEGKNLSENGYDKRITLNSLGVNGKVY